MNTTVQFPASLPELKLPRAADKWAHTLDEERQRLQEDFEALRQRELNLREYEERLRAWQADLDARPISTPSLRIGSASPLPIRHSSRTPFADEVALHGAWEKLHRARELLDAEQAHLRDDRMAVRDQEEALKRREQELALREARLAEREALVAAATPPPASIETQSAMTRFTRAPFELARAVLRNK